MTAVQLVLDAPLLKDIDRQAKRLSLSRSEFVRNAMRETLARLQYLDDIEVERRAYARKPPTRAERVGQRALQRGGRAGVAADGDLW